MLVTHTKNIIIIIIIINIVSYYIRYYQILHYIK